MSAVGAYSATSVRNAELVEDLRSSARASAPRYASASGSKSTGTSVRIRASSRLWRASSACAEQPLAIALVLDLGGVRQQVVERSVGGDQLARALLADAGHALDVVDRVAHQRQDVDDLLRRDAELLLHALRVVPGAFVARVEDADAVADQLKEILVAS